MVTILNVFTAVYAQMPWHYATRVSSLTEYAAVRSFLIQANELDSVQWTQCNEHTSTANALLENGRIERSRTKRKSISFIRLEAH